MKSVLISIRPFWCDLIASGQKTVEVRKTRPKLETPFRCYIYCTMGNPDDPKQRLELHTEDGKNYLMNGTVIGEFICDDCSALCKHHISYIEKYAMLPKEKLFEYLGISRTKDLTYKNMGCYGWNISELKIYDKPKNLSEFYIWKKCNSCRASGYESSACIYDEDCRVPAAITRPPQSWCYVEEML